MNIVGLITEYNPFHNGHLYHIEEAKRITGADTAIVVMSGDFVQRGTPAIFDKYTRAEMALRSGADIIIELPACYATASAETFALGACSILDRLGIIDHLVFGSECGDLSILSAIAKTLTEEPQSLKLRLQEYLKQGLTYPAARAKAFLDYYQDSSAATSLLEAFDLSQLESILNSPNNILGIEYLKALNTLNSRIKPHTITRIQADYHGEHITGKISSATAIRKAIETSPSSVEEVIKASIPAAALQVLIEQYHQTGPIDSEQLNLLIRSKLLFEDISSLVKYQDLSEDLARRILTASITPGSYESLVDQIKSKQYTRTRIQRCLLHILLEFKKDDFTYFLKDKLTPYARILGFRKSKMSCIREAKEFNQIEIITKLANTPNELLYHPMMKYDIAAARLYQHLIYQSYKTSVRDEFTRNLVILP